jgi:hypothetical protein
MHQVNKQQKHTCKASKNGEWILEYLGAILDIWRPLIAHKAIDFEKISQTMKSMSQFFRVSASNVGHMTHHMTICPPGLRNLVM